MCVCVGGQIKLDMLGHDSMPSHVAGALRKHHVREEERRDKARCVCVVVFHVLY